MRTRTALLTGSLLFATAGVFAQVPNPVTTAIPSASTTASVTVGQTITLSGTAYTVSSKKVLATGVEFYVMRSAASSKGKTVNYLRSAMGLGPTVFTQAQYEAFFTSGKLSSFGTLKQETVKGGAWYVVKGTRTVLLTVTGDGHGLTIDELPDGMTVAKMRDSGSNAWKGCRDGCDTDYGVCTSTRSSESGGCYDGAKACACELLACARRCDDNIPIIQRPDTHVCWTSVSILKK